MSSKNSRLALSALCLVVACAALIGANASYTLRAARAHEDAAQSAHSELLSIAYESWRDEPFTIGVELEGQKITPDKPFTATDGWIGRLKITARNTSERPIVALTVEMIAAGKGDAPGFKRDFAYNVG